MARRKSPEDQEWDYIFNNIILETEPEPKYIKQAVIHTRTGQKYKLSGTEFANIMEHERSLDPQEAVIESCKLTLDFQKIKDDVNKFALRSFQKSSKRYAKSKRQSQQTRALNRLPKRVTQTKAADS
jgi:hypothetical protein